MDYRPAWVWAGRIGTITTAIILAVDHARLGHEHINMLGRRDNCGSGECPPQSRVEAVAKDMKRYSFAARPTRWTSTLGGLLAPRGNSDATIRTHGHVRIPSPRPARVLGVVGGVR